MDQVSWTKSENRNDFESFFDFSPWNDHSRSFKPESFVLNAIRRSLLAEQVKLRLTKTSRGKKVVWDLRTKMSHEQQQRVDARLVKNHICP